MNLPMLYETITEGIVLHCPGPDKFAHVCAGMGFLLAAAVLLRKPLTSPAPLLVVAVLELMNECMDRLAHGSWRWHDTLGDAAATLFWPAILFAALNFCPWLGLPRGKAPASLAEAKE